MRKPKRMDDKESKDRYKVWRERFPAAAVKELIEYEATVAMLISRIHAQKKTIERLEEINRMLKEES